MLPRLHREGFARCGPHRYRDVNLDRVELDRSMAAWAAGDHAAIRSILARGADRLARAGADFFACPHNTAHVALEGPGPDLALPGLHVAEIAAEPAARDGRRKVAVLGTAFTMNGPAYPRALAPRGIGQAFMIERLAAGGCDAVALACTEIPLPVTPEASVLPTPDSTRSLARAAFEATIGERPPPTWRGGPLPNPAQGRP